MHELEEVDRHHLSLHLSNIVYNVPLAFIKKVQVEQGTLMINFVNIKFLKTAKGRNVAFHG